MTEMYSCERIQTSVHTDTLSLRSLRESSLPCSFSLGNVQSELQLPKTRYPFPNYLYQRSEISTNNNFFFRGDRDILSRGLKYTNLI